jgi:putative phosphoribosyl transferase
MYPTEAAMQFRNREDAAIRLAERLDTYRGQHPLVLGIPRGGVAMARVIADRLGGDLDVILVHKLRAPDQPELAVGSVDESGRVYFASFVRELAIDEHTMDAEIEAQRQLLQARRRRYSAARPPIDLSGRTVIIVDDGLATGSTAIAAIRSARAERAARVVVAAAVAPPETVARLGEEADEVVCLHTPAAFAAVGQFFADFSEVSDDDVVRALTASGPGPGGPGRPSHDRP